MATPAEEFEKAMATALYSAYERGRGGEFRAFSSVSTELQTKWHMVAREMIRFAEYNRRARVDLVRDRETGEWRKEYDALSAPPPDWTVPV